ncbi:MAG: FAD-binding oxidoreductase [Novosphingobium sp.]|nr:FAD-binding oxidoreductase [Novosphingobium sp.]
MSEHFDIAIVGAGIAGASLAAGIAGQGRVVLLDAEDTPGYHSTGRSAAFWTESYGGPQIQPLTAASGPFLRQGGFLRQRGALTVGRDEQAEDVARFAAEFSALGVAVQRLDRAGLEALVPGLCPGWSHGAYEPSCADIDVAALHQHYLSEAKRGGVELRTRARLVSASRNATGWSVELASGERLTCDALVNAAGAWADEVALAAGVRPLGITPYRRTIAQLAVVPAPPTDMPLVLDVAEKFYFKPEAGGVWLSPHDETQSPPCDAAPEEIDVALAIERFGHVVDWKIERVTHRWAGLRSFAPDRLPVYGFDPAEPRFFWFAGQGGFGIQTAPAAATIGAALLTGGGQMPVNPQPFSPNRFA